MSLWVVGGEEGSQQKNNNTPTTSSSFLLGLWLREALALLGEIRGDIATIKTFVFKELKGGRTNPPESVSASFSALVRSSSPPRDCGTDS